MSRIPTPAAGSYSLLMVYDQGTAYGYAEKLAARRREIYAGNVKISVQPQWDELRLTAAPAVYDEMVFHDNAKDIAWFHEHLREMAEATAKAICDMFGAAFVDPYAKPAEPAPDAGIRRGCLVPCAGRGVPRKGQRRPAVRRAAGKGYSAFVKAGA